MSAILHGDCLELMNDIPDGSIDMILCDLPYGSTLCKWDVVIPFEPLWEQYNRIVKDRGAIVLTGTEPFSSRLRMSNLKGYKYDWVWDKKIPTGMAFAKSQPMRRYENIIVFTKSGKSTVYNPQLIKRDKVMVKKTNVTYSPSQPGANKNNKHYSNTYEYKQPTNIIVFQKVWGKNHFTYHPTQKPVELFEYLVKTYTNEGDVVLDNCAGSGTTGIACINTNRNYILIEKEQEYYDICVMRCDEASKAKVAARE